MVPFLIELSVGRGGVTESVCDGFGRSELSVGAFELVSAGLDVGLTDSVTTDDEETGVPEENAGELDATDLLVDAG